MRTIDSHAPTNGQAAPPALPPGTPPHLSLRTIVVGTAVFWGMPLLGLLVARYIDVLLVVFLAVLLSTFLSPVVNWLERSHIRRSLGILLVYLFLAGVAAASGYLAVPLFLMETQRLAQQLPADLQHLAAPLRRLGITLPPSWRSLSLATVLSAASQRMTDVANQALSVATTLGQLAVALFSIVVMAFFLTVRSTFAADVVSSIAPVAHRERTATILSRMGERMGHWVVGQLIVTVYYAFAFSLGLYVLHVPNPLTIGVITGVLELIPFVGGVVGTLLAIVVAANVKLTLVLWVLVLYVVVSQVEGQVLLPNIYGRAVHLHPVLVIVALLIGAETFGLIGALVAIPLAAALQVGVEELYLKDALPAAGWQRGWRGWRWPLLPPRCRDERCPPPAGPSRREGQ